MLDNFVPAGEGKVWAPVGSEDWAKNMRLSMTTMVKGLNDEPQRFARYVALFTEHRGWTLLTDKRGKRFATWEAFCEEAPPYGLGKPAAEIAPFLKAALGERKAALVMVAPDRRAENGAGQQRDEAGRVLPKEEADSPPGEAKRDGHAAEERNRAILRAPSEVQRLYCDDLVSQKLAASLGPVKQTPEKAAKIREAVNEAVSIVDAENPLDREARRVVKKRVDAKIREVIGAKAETSPKAFGDLLARINKLPSEDRTTLVCEVIEHLDAVHFHRVREALDARKES